MLPILAFAGAGCCFPRAWLSGIKLPERTWDPDDMFVIDGRVHAHDKETGVALVIDPHRLTWREAATGVAAYDADCIVRRDGTVVPHAGRRWAGPREGGRFTRGGLVIATDAHVTMRAKVDGVEMMQVPSRPVDALDYWRNRVWTCTTGLASAGTGDADWVPARLLLHERYPRPEKIAHLCFGRTLFAFSDGSRLYIGDPRPDELEVCQVIDLEGAITALRFNARESEKVVASTAGRTWLWDPLSREGYRQVPTTGRVFVTSETSYFAIEGSRLMASDSAGLRDATVPLDTVARVVNVALRAITIPLDVVQFIITWFTPLGWIIGKPWWDGLEGLWSR